MTDHDNPTDPYDNNENRLDGANYRIVADEHCNVCKHSHFARASCGHVVETCHHPELDEDDEHGWPVVDASRICSWFEHRYLSPVKESATDHDAAEAAACREAFDKWVTESGADFDIAKYESPDDNRVNIYMDSATADAFDGFQAAYATTQADITQLQDAVQEVLCSPGSVHLDGSTITKLQAVRGSPIERFPHPAELAELREAFKPVLHWYNGDGEEDDFPEMLTAAIEDLQSDRKDALQLKTITAELATAKAELATLREKRLADLWKFIDEQYPKESGPGWLSRDAQRRLLQEFLQEFEEADKTKGGSDD